MTMNTMKTCVGHHYEEHLQTAIDDLYQLCKTHLTRNWEEQKPTYVLDERNGKWVCWVMVNGSMEEGQGDTRLRAKQAAALAMLDSWIL